MLCALWGFRLGTTEVEIRGPFARRGEPTSGAGVNSRSGQEPQGVASRPTWGHKHGVHRLIWKLAANTGAGRGVPGLHPSSHRDGEADARAGRGEGDRWAQGGHGEPHGEMHPLPLPAGGHRKPRGQSRQPRASPSSVLSRMLRMSASSRVSSSGCWATYGCTHCTWGQSEGRRGWSIFIMWHPPWPGTRPGRAPAEPGPAPPPSPLHPHPTLSRRPGGPAAAGKGLIGGRGGRGSKEKDVKTSHRGCRDEQAVGGS